MRALDPDQGFRQNAHGRADVAIVSQRLDAHIRATGLELRGLPWPDDPTQAGSRRERCTGGIEPSDEA